MEQALGITGQTELSPWALGAVQAEFTEYTNGTFWIGFVGLLCLVFGFILFCLSVAGWGLLNQFEKILCVLADLAAILGGTECMSRHFRSRKVRVAIHELGLLIEWTGQPEIVIWEEIIAVTERIKKIYTDKGRSSYDRFVYTVTKTDGEILKFGHLLSDSSQFGRVLRKYVPVR